MKEFVEQLRKKAKKIADSDAETADMLKKAADAVEASKTPWISVLERMPIGKPLVDRIPFSDYEDGEIILGMDNVGVAHVLFYDDGKWYFQSGDEYHNNVLPIVYWMPVPKCNYKEQRFKG